MNACASVWMRSCSTVINLEVDAQAELALAEEDARAQELAQDTFSDLYNSILRYKIAVVHHMI